MSEVVVRGLTAESTSVVQGTFPAICLVFCSSVFRVSLSPSLLPLLGCLPLLTRSSWVTQGTQKHSRTAPGGLDAEACRLRPPLFLRGQGFCFEFAWNSRDGSLGEHIKAALGSHDVELVSIAATSVVSHNGCHSTALPGRNFKSCWRWLTMKGTEATGVAKRGCHDHGLAVVTRFGFTSPLLFVLFVVLLKDSTSGNSGPGRNPSVEQ